ncbi:MAG TPA: M50 family metallopeptidase [Chloroflexota bacterium]
MTIFVGILTFFVILAVLILVHELGHFTLAKVMGVRVEEFGLGFPPRLRSWKLRGTVYSLNALPLGGFVKMTGENGEDDDPASFAAKAPWQRLLILLFGPVMNLTLAVGIFFFAFMGGSPRGLTIVTGVSAGSPAALAHIRVGDTIVDAGGVHVNYLSDLQHITTSHLGKPLKIKVVRNHRFRTVSLVPRPKPPVNQGPMGIALSKVTTVTYSPGTALRMSVQQVADMIGSIPLLLQNVSQHGGGQVTGPIGIAHLTTQVVQQEPQQGPSSLFLFVALLSANLGVLNLLPIPALDGGRIVFVLLSWARRRNLNPEIEGVIHMVGMAVLLMLILVISYQDIVRWVTGGTF